MKKRIITGIVILFVMVPLAFLSASPVFYIFFAILSGISAYEIVTCAGTGNDLAVSVPSALLCGFGPLLCGLLGEKMVLPHSPAVISVYLLWLSSIYMLQAGKDNGKQKAGHAALSQICITGFFSLYTTFGFSYLVLMGTGSKGGIYLVIAVFVISYMTDICAYFTGFFFGKHKLIPAISPKKTIEGAIGGTLMGTVGTVAYGLIISSVSAEINGVNLAALIAAGLIGSVVSQFGDLLMSALKRSFGVKDFGWILPGHGGILDRFDSVLAVSIFFYSFNSFVNVFTAV